MLNFTPRKKKPKFNLKTIMVQETQIVECVPNISEGRDKEIINQVTDDI